MLQTVARPATITAIVGAVLFLVGIVNSVVVMYNSWADYGVCFCRSVGVKGRSRERYLRPSCSPVIVIQ